MKLLILFLLALLNASTAQPIDLDPDVFGRRREEFMRALQPRGYALFPAKPVYTRNLDVEYEFRQESNFYYLSGFEEPNSILLLNPSAPRYKYVMFVRQRDPRRETYDGPRAGVEGAVTVFKADTAILYSDFRNTIYSFMNYDGPLYYTFGISREVDEMVQDLCIDARSGTNCPVIDPAPLLAEMRLIKNDGDWRMGLQKAIDISAQGHIEAIRAIRPGMYEYEVQAVFEYIFRRNGSPRNGYPCIIGSGPNSGILHYNKNTRRMNDGEIVLMDCGAEYGYYTADITRTVPVNGRFSSEQRAIYQIVLDAQNAAMSLVQPGVSLHTLDSVITTTLGAGLLKLGFIKGQTDSRLFSLHGFCHWIGLDVHDVGGYSRNGRSIVLTPGMVFTIEPGVYVREQVFDDMKRRGYTEDEISSIRSRVEPSLGIGVRIEDDVLVTEGGYRNLSAAVPRDIEALEELMRH